jgi:hypothetical protein
MSVTTATYRKTRQGEWVVFGPADGILRGNTVAVTKKDGTVKTEYIERVGKTFTADGTICCYGYPGKTPAPATGSRWASCTACRCHREHNAGQPGSILFDGCDRCGCEAC